MFWFLSILNKHTINSLGADFFEFSLLNWVMDLYSTVGAFISFLHICRTVLYHFNFLLQLPLYLKCKNVKHFVQLSLVTCYEATVTGFILQKWSRFTTVSLRGNAYSCDLCLQSFCHLTTIQFIKWLICSAMTANNRTLVKVNMYS